MSARLAATPQDTTALVERLRRLASGGRRVMVGVVGAPGAGKSTLTDLLEARLAAEGLGAVTVPMDGFHLAQAELVRLGRAERKGAIDTFDAHGYLALLHRLRDQGPEDGVVYAPRYVRGAVEESIGSSIPVPADVRVVLTEGNYLLADVPPWDRVRDVLDETWYLETDAERRRERLLARHLANGKTPERARAFTDGSDERNAEVIAATAARADLVVHWG